MTSCCVLGCGNKSNKQCFDTGGKKIGYHRLPNRDRSPLRHKEWLEKITRTDFIPPSHARICSSHFAKEDFELSPSLKDCMSIYNSGSSRVLKKSAVPSINMTGHKPELDEASSSNEPEKKKRRQRVVKVEENSEKNAKATSSRLGEFAFMDVEPDIDTTLLVASQSLPNEQPTTCEIGIQCNLLGAELQSNFPKKVEPESESDDLFKRSLSDVGSESNDEIVGDLDVGLPSKSKVKKKRRLKDYDVYFVFWEFLKPLFQFCSKCGGSIVQIKKSTRGTMLIVTTKCKNMHISQWKSQPTHNKYEIGTIKMATAIYCTGIDFKKFESLTNALNALLMSETTYYDILRHFISPVIKHMWGKHKQKNICEIMEKVDEAGAWVSGDGQYDSPGYGTKYCTYTIMDVKTSKIIDFVVHKGFLTGELEKPACDALLSRLLEYGINIKLFLSDQNPGIKEIMRKKHSTITHKFDVWHVCQSLRKSLTALESKAPGLESWKPSVLTHLWWSSTTCAGNDTILVEKFTSLLHHVTNKHSWEGNSHFHQCAHDQLSEDDERDIDWLDPESHDFRLLSGVLLHPRFIKDLRHTKHFCLTGSYESYHSTRLRYLPRKSHFSYDGMVLRTMLAVMDHNARVDREASQTEVPYSERANMLGASMNGLATDDLWVKHLVDKVCAVVAGNDSSVENDPYHVEVQTDVELNARHDSEDMAESHFIRFQQY